MDFEANEKKSQAALKDKEKAYSEEKTKQIKKIDYLTKELNSVRE